MIELVAFWNFFESGRLKEVLCTGITNENTKIERTIIYNSKNGNLYEYDSFKEKFVLKEKIKYMSEDFMGIVGYSGTYTTESIFVGNDLKFKEIQSGGGNIFGFPVQGESTEIIKIINARNEGLNYNARYSLTGFNGFVNLDAKTNLNCKLIDTYPLWKIINYTYPKFSRIIFYKQLVDLRLYLDLVKGNWELKAFKEV